MTETAAVYPAPSPDSVLADIAAMLRVLLDEYGLDDTAITRESRFHDDLELESIDLVALAGALGERYGNAVNFAQFIAGLELEQIIALTVGELVDYVLAALEGSVTLEDPAALEDPAEQDG